MRCLLDTCAFIWLDQDPTRFSPQIAAILADPANELWVSYISLWEIQVKLSSGKLTLSGPLSDVIRDQTLHNRVELLPLKMEHILEMSQLPRHHKDAIDRLLIAQAKFEGLSIVTSDGEFPAYGVPILW